MKQHIDKVHKNVRFACDKCDHKAMSKQQLKIHEEIKHAKNYRFKCTDCDIKGYFASAIRKHYDNTKCKGSIESA